jgi:hypothetical protein
MKNHNPASKSNANPAAQSSGAAQIPENVGVSRLKLKPKLWQN